MTMEIIKVGELDIAYNIREGGNDCVFFLHGWGGSRHSFSPLWEKLQLNATLIAPDFPGFGNSAKPGIPWDMRDYADFLEHFCLEILRKHGLAHSVTFVVHSFGGRCIFKFFEKARKFQTLKLVLIAAAGIKHPDSLKSRISKGCSALVHKILPNATQNRLFQKLRKVTYRLLRSHDYEGLDPIMKKTFRNVVDEDLLNCVKKITIPTKIFWGALDTYVPLADAKIMHEIIPHSTLTVFKEGSHGIHKTHASEIAAEIQDFLNTQND